MGEGAKEIKDVGAYICTLLFPEKGFKGNMAKGWYLLSAPDGGYVSILNFIFNFILHV